MFPKHVNEQMPQFSANSQKIQKNQLGKESAQIIKTKINQRVMRYYIHNIIFWFFSFYITNNKSPKFLFMLAG